MKKSVLLVLIGKRNDAAVKVQQVLTGWGCMIKTRLGIHDGVLNECSEHGTLFLELVGEDEKKKELERKLSVLPSVHAQLVELELDED